MSSIVIYTVVSLSSIGVIAAIILYFIAQKFKVYEDPRIDQVEEALPSANCGGCGFAGCRNFAEAIVKAEDFSDLFCPVGGNDLMADVSKILGKDAVAKDPQVAVVRCSGSCESRPKTNNYDGAKTCAISSALYGGDTGCQFGCLGLGDCVSSCSFDALHMDEETGLPVVIDDNCTACGACVKACPNHIIELRKRNKKDRKICVSCVNQDKGGIAKKSCSVACIGCNKCFKVCAYDAITMNNNLAFIDGDKCKLCRKCVAECPTGSILEIGFPPPREKQPTVAKEASAKAETKAAPEKEAAPKKESDSDNTKLSNE